MRNTRRMRTDYRQCARCRCSLDPSEGRIYPGTGLVCEDCGLELDREARFCEEWGLTKDFMEWMREKKLNRPEIMQG